MQNHTIFAESTNPIGVMIVAADNVPTLSPGAPGNQQARARRRWFLHRDRP